MLKVYQEAANELQTIADFFRFGYSQALEHDLYYGHGTDNAWEEIQALVLGSLNLPFDFDSTLWSTRLTSHERKKLAQNLEKRMIQRVPVPYITHEAFFKGLSFYVDDRVLIPRSPIAELIEAHFEPWTHQDEVHQILDLCTGSGCIAIACCEAFPFAQVDAVDLSPEALEVAKINQERHQVFEQLTLIQSDCFDTVPQKQYDIIVSNPPYVSFEEMQTLPQEYLHEPKLALEAERDGLAIVDKILKQAPHYLSPNGILVIEVGNTQEAFETHYPDLPCIWLDFERGGQGVCVITQKDLFVYHSKHA